MEQNKPIRKELPNGVVEWTLNKVLHRTDGPAWIQGDIQVWCLEGKHYDCPEEMPMSLYLAWIKWNNQ